MKAFTALILVCLIVSVSLIASTVGASGVTKTGVKKGDWIEYTINISGPPLDQVRNLTWYKNEILEVNGTSFQTNMTSISVNGTVLSTIWHFNLAEGQVQGWEIIPANLSVGDTFFDAAKHANITVEGQEQRVVAGASRTVTHATDPGKLVKEWDNNWRLCSLFRMDQKLHRSNKRHSHKHVEPPDSGAKSDRLLLADCSNHIAGSYHIIFSVCCRKEKTEHETNFAASFTGKNRSPHHLCRCFGRD